MRNSSVRICQERDQYVQAILLASVFEADIFCDICQPAAIQHETGKAHLGRKVRCREWLHAGDDKVKGVRRPRRKAGCVLSSADHPTRALLIKQKHHGSRRLDLLSQAMLQRQRNHGLLSDDFRR